MEWIQNLSTFEDKSLLKKLDRFTLHDHNYVSTVDEKEKTFNCLLNLKKINRIHHTLCEIDGDMKIGQINLTCWLL